MKILPNLLVGILTARNGYQSRVRTETPTGLMTLEQGAGEERLCHVHYERKVGYINYDPTQ